MGYHTVLNFIVTGFTLAGAALPQIVVASDSEGSNPDQLTEEFAAISQNPLPAYLRWYFAGGLSVGTLAMGTMSLGCSDNTVSAVTSQKREIPASPLAEMENADSVWDYVDVDFIASCRNQSRLTPISEYNYRHLLSRSIPGNMGSKSNWFKVV